MSETDLQPWASAPEPVDAAGFAAVVDLHKDSLINYLCHLSGGREEAEEHAQEAFLRLYRAAPHAREAERLAPYLFRIATNLVRSSRRRQRRWSRILPQLVAAQGNGHSPAASRRLLGEELRGQVRAAIGELPLKLRAPLVLHEIEGWTYQRIAEALDCREGTVKSRVFRARQQLKRRLEPYWNGGPP